MLACLFESCFFFTFIPLLHPEAIFLPWCTHSSLLSLLSIQPRRYRSLVSLSCTSNHSYILLTPFSILVTGTFILPVLAG